MFKCWNCGTEHEYPATSVALNRDIKADPIESYRLGYAKGREEAWMAIYDLGRKEGYNDEA